MTTPETRIQAARENIARLEKELTHAKADLLLAIEKSHGLVPGVTRLRVTDGSSSGVKAGTEFIYYAITVDWAKRPWVNGVRPGGKQVRNLYDSWEVVK